MHSHEDKVRMIELYLRYNRSATPVTNDPGYPNRRILRLWHKKFEVSKDDAFRYLAMGRPPTEVDCAARRKQPARPLHVISHLHPQATPQPPTPDQPSPIPNSAQTHASSIRPRNKQPLGKQPQTATTNQQAIISPRS